MSQRTGAFLKIILKACYVYVMIGLENVNSRKGLCMSTELHEFSPNRENSWKNPTGIHYGSELIQVNTGNYV